MQFHPIPAWNSSVWINIIGELELFRMDYFRCKPTNWKDKIMVAISYELW